MGTCNAATREQVIQWAKDNNVTELMKLIAEKESEGQPDEVYHDKTGNKVNVSGLWSGPENMGGWNGSNTPAEPNYTIFDYIALYSSPAAIEKMAEKVDIFPNPYHGSDFTLSAEGVEQEYSNKKASTGDPKAIGYLISEMKWSYVGNPIATLASTGNLDRLKKYIEILKKQSGEKNFSDQINSPVANFGTGKLAKHFIFGGNAFILALLNGNKDIAQYLLDNGALPIGSSMDTNKAFIVRPNKNGYLQTPEELNIRQLIKNAGLKVSEASYHIREEAKKREEIKQLKTLSKKDLQSTLLDAIHARDFGKIKQIKSINPTMLTETFSPDGRSPIDNLRSIFIHAIYARDLDTIKQIKDINPTMLVETFSDETSPITAAPDREIAEYLYTQFAEQGRKLTKADLKELVISDSKAWLLKYLVNMGATSFVELEAIKKDTEREGKMREEEKKLVGEKLAYSKVK